MAARRISKKKKGKSPPSQVPEQQTSAWETGNKAWTDFRDASGGDFLSTLRAATAASGVMEQLGLRPVQALSASPAVSQLLAQIEPLSDFKPRQRQEYNQFFRNWRAKVIGNYNKLGSKIPSMAKQAALAEAWAQGVVGMADVLRNQSDPNPVLKTIPESLLRSIYRDFGGPENFIGFEQLGSESIWDSIYSIWSSMARIWGNMSNAVWEIVNGIVTSVGGAIDSASNWISNVWTAIMQLGSDMWHSIGTHISFVGNTLTSFAVSVTNTIWDSITSLRDKIMAAFYELQTIISNTIGTLTQNLSSFFSGLRDGLVGAFDRARAEISLQLTALADYLWEAATEVWSNISQTMLEVPAFAWNIVNEAKAGIMAALDSQLSGSLYGSFQSARASMTDFISSGYGMLEQYLRSQVPITPDNIPTVAAGAVTMAGGFGLAAHLSSAFFELAHPLKELGLHQISGFLSQMAGFSGITAATMGIMTGIALRQPSMYYANNMFRPRIPGEGVLIDMATKPDISLQDFQKYFGWYGYSEQWINRTIKTMYKEPGHRELLLMSEDSPIDERWLLTKIMRAGYEVPDAEKLVTGVMAKNESTERRMVFSALGRLSKEGYITAYDFSSQIAPLGMRAENIALVMKAQELNYAYDRINDLVRLYSDEYQKEVLADYELETALTALGIIPEKVDFLVAKARIRKLPRPVHPEKAENARSVAAAQKKYVALYIDQFRKELIDAVQLRLYLDQIGLTAALADVTTQQEIVRKLPIPSVVATRTTERAEREVTKLYTSLYQDQFRKELIDQEQLLYRFVSLGIPAEKAEVMVDLEVLRAYEPPSVEVV